MTRLNPRRMTGFSSRLVAIGAAAVLGVGGGIVARHWLASGAEAAPAFDVVSLTRDREALIKASKVSPDRLRRAQREKVSEPDARAPAAWDDRWAAAVGLPASPRRDAQCAVLLEELGGKEPLRALVLAGESLVRRQRRTFIGAAMRGWAAVEPKAAADWVFQCLNDADERDAAIESVARGVARLTDVTLAIETIERLDRDDPENGYAHRRDFVSSLGERGAFATAAEFAGGVTGEYRGELVARVYETWAARHPDLAAASALALSDEKLREQAWCSVVSGWAMVDAAGLAKYSFRLPPGSARTMALGEALRHWVLEDSGAATAWIDEQRPGTELDAGAAAVASFAPLAERRPDVALGWAESIVDPALRSQTVASVVRAWARRDAGAAGRYVQLNGVSLSDGGVTTGE